MQVYIHFSYCITKNHKVPKVWDAIIKHIGWQPQYPPKHSQSKFDRKWQTYAQFEFPSQSELFAWMNKAAWLWSRVHFGMPFMAEAELGTNIKWVESIYLDEVVGDCDKTQPLTFTLAI